MVRKRDPAASGAPRRWCRNSPTRWPRRTSSVPAGLDFAGYDFALAGEPWRWDDYAVGEQIDHVDRVTVDEAEHMLATRLWQNTAKVHFDVTAREDGRRLIYGGHVISLARALSFNGLANAQLVAAINAGAHANPCFAGDTVGAWTDGARQGRDRGAGSRRPPSPDRRGQGGSAAVRASRRGGEIPARASFSTSTTGFWCRAEVYVITTFPAVITISIWLAFGRWGVAVTGIQLPAAVQYREVRGARWPMRGETWLT